MSKAGRHWIISKTAICVFDQADAPYTTLIENENEGGKKNEKKRRKQTDATRNYHPSIWSWNPSWCNSKKKKKKGGRNLRDLKQGEGPELVAFSPLYFGCL